MGRIGWEEAGQCVGLSQGSLIRGSAKGLAIRPYHRRSGGGWSRTGCWFGRIVFSPFLVLRELFLGGSRIGPGWVQGYLLLGMLILVSTGVALLSSEAADRKVFAALGRFDPQHEHVPRTEQYAEEVNVAASRYGLNPIAVFYVIQIESRGRPLRISPQGARGLMQIMPLTWRALNPASACRGEHEPFICTAGRECIFSAWGNIRVGTLYLSRLLRLYDGDYVAALQAYNAGQQNVVLSGEAKYPETRKYVQSFLERLGELQAKQLTVRLRAAARYRLWVGPLFLALGVYTVLGTAFFWRRHRRAV